MCLPLPLPRPTDYLQASLFNTGFQQLNYEVAWWYWFFCLFVVYPPRFSEFFRPMVWCVSFLRNSLLSLKIFLLLCSLTHFLVQKRGVDTCPHTATGDPLHACTTERGSVPSPICLPSLSPSGGLWGKLVSECRLPLCLQHRHSFWTDTLTHNQLLVKI